MRRVASLSLTLLTVASTGHAGSYALGLGASGGYSQGDNWTLSGRSSTSTWDVGVSANAKGTPLRPGLLVFGAAGKFEGRRSLFPQNSTADNRWGFQVSVNALSDTPVPVQFSASRDWGEFMSNVSPTQTGVTTATSIGMTTQVKFARFPSLRLSIGRTMVENVSFGSQRTFAGSTSLSTSVDHSQGTQTYAIGYSTSWNNGTFVENNYQSHGVSVAASARPHEAINLRLSERYYLRLPLISAPTNPRYDDNAFTIGVDRPSRKVGLSADYSYRRLLVTAPTAADIEQTTHRVGSQASVRISPNLDAIANGSVLFNLERLGISRLWGANQSLGAGVNWRAKRGDTLNFSAGAGAGGGLSEPSTGGLLGSWGGDANLGAAVRLDWLQANASYTIGYHRNNLGLSGWTLSQQGNFSATTSLRGVGLRLFLAGNGGRRDDPLFGTMLNRTLSLSLSVGWRGWGATLGAGISEGLSAALANPGFVDGLFLPAPYNTVSRFANLGISKSFLGGSLVTSLSGRTMWTSAPGRPDQSEHGFSLMVSYQLGAFVLSFDERFSVGASAGRSQSSNGFMLRISRGFNWSF